MNVAGFSYFQSYPILGYLEYPALILQNVVLLATLADISGNYFRPTCFITLLTAWFFIIGNIPKNIALFVIVSKYSLSNSHYLL